MPRIGKAARNREAEHVEAVLAARAEFAAGFRRSRKGNLTREWEGLRLTIFRRKGDGCFGWSVADEEGPRFSPGGYETEEEALLALGFAMGIDERPDAT